MPFEKGRELAHLRAGCAVGSLLRNELTELGGGPVEPLVLEEGLHDQVPSLLGVGDTGKEQLLLFAKVRHDRGREERQECGGRLEHVRRACATTEAARRNQGVVMVMGERDQRSMPFHLFERSGDGFAKDRLR
jgi:hypothetical protein